MYLTVVLVQDSQQVYHTANANIQIILGDIFYLCYKPDVLLELSDFKESYAAYWQLSAHRKLKVLIEFPEYTSASDEARKYATDVVVETVATAFVFKSLAQRILIRAYYLFHKSEHPIKLFTRKELALDWLISID